MQPYFFPYLGYFDLICHTDRWVVFDTAQYIRHGWVNRNRILHPESGWQYVIAPLRKHARSAPIRDVHVSDDAGWRRRMAGQLMHYRKEAPFYEETIALIESCLAIPETSLARFDVAILDAVCRRLEIPFRREFFSEMALEIGPVEGPGDWALGIAAALGADEYVNPPGGRDLFDPARFEAKGIRLSIREFRNMEYSCGRHDFVPALSIIDALMWNSCGAVRRYLHEWN